MKNFSVFACILALISIFTLSGCDIIMKSLEDNPEDTVDNDFTDRIYNVQVNVAINMGVASQMLYVAIVKSSESCNTSTIAGINNKLTTLAAPTSATVTIGGIHAGDFRICGYIDVDNNGLYSNGDFCNVDTTAFTIPLGDGRETIFGNNIEINGQVFPPDFECSI